MPTHSPTHEIMCIGGATCGERNYHCDRKPHHKLAYRGEGSRTICSRMTPGSVAARRTHKQRNWSVDCEAATTEAKLLQLTTRFTPTLRGGGSFKNVARLSGPVSNPVLGAGVSNCQARAQSISEVAPATILLFFSSSFLGMSGRVMISNGTACFTASGR